MWNNTSLSRAPKANSRPRPRGEKTESSRPKRQREGGTREERQIHKHSEIVPQSQYKLGDEGTSRNEHTLEENRVLRREAPQGKSCLTLQEPLPCFEKRLHTTRVRHSCGRTARCATRGLWCVTVERKEGRKEERKKERSAHACCAQLCLCVSDGHTLF